MKRCWLLAPLLVAVVLLTGQRAVALKSFKSPFYERYVKPSGDQGFEAAFRKLSCNTCHVKGKKRDYVNAYGKQLADLIEGNAKDRLEAAKEQGEEAKEAEEARLLRELQQAFEKVERVRSPAGPTYGELFRAGKLPTADGAQSVR